VRAVIDTNVLLSVLFWGGPPHVLLEHVRGGAVVMISSPGLLAEFADVLGRPKFQAILAGSGTKPELLLAELRRIAEIIDAPPLPEPVCRDPDDDAVLALAVAAQADLVVSGDADLLDLGAYSGIRIVAPAQSLSIIAHPCN